MSTAAAVLAVDDNATIRKAISMRLGAKGFEVVTAADGRSALDLMASYPLFSQKAECWPRSAAWRKAHPEAAKGEIIYLELKESR